MKKRFTEQQIAFALGQAASGTLLREFIRRMGICEATFCRWRRLYAGMAVPEISRLKEPENENRRLKQLVAPTAHPKALEIRSQRVISSYW